ncbi:hypothetical protein [Winogradskyella alexanderae]|uniref:Uncharacterized protein n=1 Tax=Winogradskyella alexanderae TaxID=2877123 RepID=A0ABS7XMA2_9FLAO|nr:hypothetical protein [Winogradskyella alexanderae]MCA0131103.1 hypothetical protein [Winogradskyella alexanderae]
MKILAEFYLLVQQPMTLKKLTAFFIVTLFLTIISAPTIITSIDNSIDISMLDGLGEEEESETFKILIQDQTTSAEQIDYSLLKKDRIVFTHGLYNKPLINIISPPPELTL